MTALFRQLIARTIAVGVLVTIAATQTGCTSDAALVSAPNLYADSPDDPFANVPAELQSVTVSVLYATDREPETVEGVYGYTADRARGMAYGLCDVRMGSEATTWAELVQASRRHERSESIELTLTRIDERGRYPRLAPMILSEDEWVEDPENVSANNDTREELHRLLSERLALTPRKEVFLFVHGYNNSFALGAFRAAQIWHFIGRGGVPVLFSWPAGSAGLLQGYTRDRESGEFANPHLKRFIRDIASCPDVQKINLICHSRGTDVLGTAMRELTNETRAAGKKPRTELKIGQFVLAAPDIDLQVFIERFGSDRVAFVADQVTVYASANDKAIGLSSWLFGSAHRLGQAGFADMDADVAQAVKHHPTLSVIDMRAKTDRTGHGYFLSSPAALSDLILVLRDGRRPGAANGRPLYDDPVGFWQLRDGYPEMIKSPAAPNRDD